MNMNTTEDNTPFSNKSNQSGTANFGTPFQPNHALAVIFWIIFVVGLVGNLFLLSVNFWRRRSTRTATEMFMVSLSIFDIGLILGSTWIHAMISVNPSFDFGRVMCKICNLWSGLAADGSVVTLSVIGVDRYLSLSRPGNCFFSVRAARIIIVLVWAVVLATDFPVILWFDIIVIDEATLACSIVGVDLDTLSHYTLIGRIITFFIPLTIIIFCYFGIWFRMILATRKKIGTGVKTSEIQASRKVARMCTLVVAIFAISWTPFEIDMLYFAYGSNKPLAISLMNQLFVIANANCCINPIVYGFMWKPMKESLLKLMDRFIRSFRGTLDFNRESTTTSTVHGTHSTLV